MNSRRVDDAGQFTSTTRRSADNFADATRGVSHDQTGTDARWERPCAAARSLLRRVCGRSRVPTLTRRSSAVRTPTDTPCSATDRAEQPRRKSTSSTRRAAYRRSAATASRRKSTPRWRPRPRPTRNARIRAAKVVRVRKAARTRAPLRRRSTAVTERLVSVQAVTPPAVRGGMAGARPRHARAAEFLRMRAPAPSRARAGSDRARSCAARSDRRRSSAR